MKSSISVVGPGIVGRTLGRALEAAGHTIMRMLGRYDAPELCWEAELVLLTVPDSVLPILAEGLASTDPPAGRVALHTSGVHGSEVLAPLREAGVAIGSMHPLQTFTDQETALASLPGTWYAVDGDEAVLLMIEGIVRSIEGRTMRVREEDRPLYHAAAVVASNYLVAGVAWGVELLQRAGGCTREEALEALLPLIRGSVRNLEVTGLPEALTGPLVRGDAQSVRHHLEALAPLGGDHVARYAILGLHALKVARERGRLSEEVFEEIRSLLSRCT